MDTFRALPCAPAVEIAVSGYGEQVAMVRDGRADVALLGSPFDRAGKYTPADLVAFRLSPTPIRGAMAVLTPVVAAIFLIAQLLGAGPLIQVLPWLRSSVDMVPSSVGSGEFDEPCIA